MAGTARRDPRLEAIYGQPIHDPREYLRTILGLISRGVQQGWHLDPKKKKLLLLRSGRHKAARELADACIFAALIEQVRGVKMSVAPVRAENHDADAFLLWRGPEEPGGFCPIQLKELPPGYLSATASLDALLLSLTKYDSPDLVLAVYVNRGPKLGVFTVPPGLRLAGLWLFGTTGPDASRWALIGDLLRSDHCLRNLKLDL